MARQIRVRSIRRKEIDEDKLALAFLMLAKILAEDERGNDLDKEDDPNRDQEAA